jgi:hypothetical protein
MGNKNMTTTTKTNQAILDYSNGEKYNGEVSDGTRNGFGTYFYQNGERYEGNWVKNAKHGRGTFFYKNGAVYEGFWNDNKREGVGTYYNHTGDRYYGEWKDNKKHGKGMIQMENGNKFIGQFRNNKKQGIGELIKKDGYVIYEEWKDGQLMRQFEKPKMGSRISVDIDYSQFNSGIFEKYLDTKTKQQLELKSNPLKSKYLTLEFAKKLKSKNPDNYYDSVRLLHNANNIIMEKPDIEQWNVDDVVILFQKLGFENTVESIKANSINGTVLLIINTESLLTMLKITGDREKLLLNNSLEIIKKSAKSKKNTQIHYSKTINLIEEEGNKSEENLSIDNNIKITDETKEEKVKYVEEGDSTSLVHKEMLNKLALQELTSPSIIVLTLARNFSASVNLNGLNYFINFDEITTQIKVGEGGKF